MLAPLSHYAFMAWSDVYVAASTHHHAAGHAPTQVMPEKMPTRAIFMDGPMASITCEYAALFATFAAPAVPTPIEHGRLSAQGYTPLPPVASISYNAPRAFQSRAPPFYHTIG
ncbi:MAG: hypothetical protein R2834_21925 [Rhodothermales bacterium]